MSKFALTIEYDGTRYHGWQIQNDQRTIQGSLESAMQKLTQHSVRIIGSGRTDTGVHARNQIAHFDSPSDAFSEDNFRLGLNAYLDEDIVVKKCQRVPDDFHARFWARQRDYSYTLSTKPLAIGREYRWYVRNSLDPALLEQCAEVVRGEHNFLSFMHARSDTENTICDIVESSWIIAPKKLRYLICGNRFLHNMVRCLVGTMIEVARGRYSLEQFRLFIELPDTETPVVRAPARGLVLERVHYKDELIASTEGT